MPETQHTPTTFQAPRQMSANQEQPMTPRTDNIILLPYRERVKLVQDRMRNLRRPKYVPLDKPARVIAAEKVCRDWERKNEAHEDAQRDAHHAKLNAIQDALIVGDMPKAVALLQKLGI